MMKKILVFFFAIFLAILEIGCNVALPKQELQKTEESEKTFFEKRYTTLSYDEYFSQMRPLRTLKNTPFNEPTLEKSNAETAGIAEDLTLYITPVSTISPSEIEVLTHIKDSAAVSNREVIYVTTKNEIYCVDHYTGEKYLLYTSPVPISNLNASLDLITYTNKNTMYIIFRPTGQVDAIEIPVDNNPMEYLYSQVYSPQLIANLLITYETSNPNYYKYVDLCAEGLITEDCWEKLIQDFGDSILNFKNTEDGRPIGSIQLEAILKTYNVSRNLTNVYDIQTGERYTYDKYQQPCPCPYPDICSEFDDTVE